MEYKNCKRWKEDYLYIRLKDDDYACAHIITAINEPDPYIVSQAIRNVINARGGLEVLADKIGRSVKDIDDILCETNLSTDIINEILNAYGLDTTCVICDPNPTNW